MSVVEPLEHSAATGPSSWDHDTREMARDFLAEGADSLAAAEDGLAKISEGDDNPEHIASIFRVFHSIKGVAGFLSLTDIAQLAHAAESLLADVRDDHLQLNESILDLLFDVSDMLRRLLQHMQDVLSGRDDQGPVSGHASLLEALRRARETPTADSPRLKSSDARLGEVLIEMGVLTRDDLDKALARQFAMKPWRDDGQVRIGEILIEEKVLAPRTIGRALQAQKTAAGIYTEEMSSGGMIRLHVPSAALDELLLDAERLVQVTSNHDQAALRTARHIRESLLQMRFVDTDAVAARIDRLAKDLSHHMGKDVELAFHSDFLQLDRGLIERLRDPLVHLVRNAVDHGLETPSDRVAAGKSPTGRLELRFVYRPGEVEIVVADDGRGLDHESIRRRGGEQGLITEGEVLSEERLHALIFEPGFSTARTITQLSGRGVGLDVVNTSVEHLGGKLSVTSRFGHGCRFQLRFPLTAAMVGVRLDKVGPRDTACLDSDGADATSAIVRPAEAYADAPASSGDIVTLEDGRMLPLRQG
ncbi:MAG: Hpt domain-containing protein [Deltaproteobacteria bacterium]|nr:Hpt domain-containing protein [Deltaproteobacteria bacterium]MCB9488613.1 Hpt domain-containing protein [Deltaproteobacteria bacterium]